MKILEGVRIVELAAIGPVPWASMLLADMGADVVRIGRPGKPIENVPTMRGRTSISLDLKTADDLSVAKRLIGHAEVLLEGMRPGALERLGLSPETCFEDNPALVIGRMTGWGQSGPLAQRAGHDINYIALNGVLHSIGRDKPVPPLNLVGDYGGGGAFLLIGVLAALLSARATGRGQVVDAAMVDGSASMMTLVYERLMAGHWQDARGINRLDGGTPWYDVYETSDRRFMAVGCIEPEFYQIFIQVLGLDLEALPDRNNQANWPVLRALFAERFASHTREEWTNVFQGTDACVTPVLSLLEAPTHPHLIARNTFCSFGHNPIPGPAPRFGTTGTTLSPRSKSEQPNDVLARWSSVDGR